MTSEQIPISQVADHLDRIGIQFMATIGLDGRPKVRPMQYMVTHNNRLWFCTNSQKEIYAELQKDPHVEVCGCILEENQISTTWIRFEGVAVFDESEEVRMAIIEKSPVVRALYKKQDNSPNFKLFYLKDIDGWMTNLGNLKGIEKKAQFAEPIHFHFD